MISHFFLQMKVIKNYIYSITKDDIYLLQDHLAVEENVRRDRVHTLPRQPNQFSKSKKKGNILYRGTICGLTEKTSFSDPDK